jgi:hypothetical protein
MAYPAALKALLEYGSQYEGSIGPTGHLQTRHHHTFSLEKCTMLTGLMV